LPLRLDALLRRVPAGQLRPDHARRDRALGRLLPARQGQHGHGEGVGHDSAEKVALDQLHKRKIDLADYVHVVSDATGYLGASTRGEIEYAITFGKPVEFAEPAAEKRAREAGLIQ
jgi:hypothetical protein